MISFNKLPLNIRANICSLLYPEESRKFLGNAPFAIEALAKIRNCNRDEAKQELRTLFRVIDSSDWECKSVRELFNCTDQFKTSTYFEVVGRLIERVLASKHEINYSTVRSLPLSYLPFKKSINHILTIQNALLDKNSSDRKQKLLEISGEITDHLNAPENLYEIEACVLPRVLTSCSRAAYEQGKYSENFELIKILNQDILDTLDIRNLLSLGEFEAASKKLQSQINERPAEAYFSEREFELIRFVKNLISEDFDQAIEVNKFPNDFSGLNSEITRNDFVNQIRQENYIDALTVNLDFFPLILLLLAARNDIALIRKILQEKELLQQIPGLENHLLNFVNCCISSNRFELAYETSKLLRNDSNRKTVALALIEKGEYEKAFAFAEQLGDEVLRSFIVEAFIEKREYEKAFILAGPLGESNCRGRVALLFIEKGEYEKAFKVAETANGTFIQYNKQGVAKAFIEKGEYEKAFALAEQTDDNGKSWIAVDFIEKGEYEKAFVLAGSLKEGIYKGRVALLFIEKGEYGKAYKLVEQMDGEDIKNCIFIYAFIFKGQYELAFELTRGLKKELYDFWIGKQAIAEAFIKKGEYEKAFKFIKDNPILCKGEAVVAFIKRGQYELAFELEKELDLSPFLRKCIREAFIFQYKLGIKQE